MPMKYEGYYFNPKFAVFAEGSTYCLEKYQVQLETPAVMKEGKLVMAAEDFNRMVSALPRELEKANGDEAAAVEILAAAGYPVKEVGACTVVVLAEDAEIPGEEEMKANLSRKPGSKGDNYNTYWHTGINRWAPFRLYLPASYQPEGKNKLLIGLHGGGGCPDNVFKNSKDRIKEYAERDGYIILAPDGVTGNSTYGCAIPPYGMPGKLDETKPENPMGLTQKELDWIHMGETGMDQVIAKICDEYAVDQKEIYLMGNSMGGMGTLYYASRHPERFKKISPAGAVPHMKFFNYNPLKDIPQFFVAGELDSHGVEWLRDGARIMKEGGVNIEYREVAQGTHSGAWVDVLEEIFDFFKK